MAPSPPDEGALSVELDTLILRQKENFKNYLLILRCQNEALQNGRDDRIDYYRRLEVASREDIISLDRHLRGLEGAIAPGPGKKADWAAQQSILESLRLEAIEANAAARLLLERKMREVKTEWDALEATIRRLDAKPAAGNDPFIIDVYS